jgi:hypothetical protein
MNLENCGFNLYFLSSSQFILLTITILASSGKSAIEVVVGNENFVVFFGLRSLPHTISYTLRKWDQGYYQLVCIDPARKNYALRIERRYHSGKIEPIVFDKVCVEKFIDYDGYKTTDTYEEVTKFLEKYREFYDDCHFVIIERQLPTNYQATRIAQHTISYFSIVLHDKPLLANIIEVSPQLKGKMLGFKKGNDKELKSWAVLVARELLTIRKDDYSLKVMDYFAKKQDDLADTVIMIEALMKLWGYPLTVPIDNKIKIRVADKSLATEVKNIPNTKTKTLTMIIHEPKNRLA